MSKKTPAAGPVRSVIEDNFSFELLRSYPEARAFVIKRPLKGSIADAVFELVGGKR